MNDLNSKSFLIKDHMSKSNSGFEINFDAYGNLSEIIDIERVDISQGLGCYIDILNKGKTFFAYIVLYDECKYTRKVYFLVDDNIYNVENSQFKLSRKSFSHREFLVNDNKYIYKYSLIKSLIDNPFSDVFNYDPNDFFIDFKKWILDR